MASYEDTIVADAPIWYARLDELSGSVMTARLGPDGTYFSDAVFGLASPIQTDSSSRAIGARVGTVPSSIETLSAFSWEAWGRYSLDLSLTGSLIVRGGQVGLSSSNYLVIDDGSARAQCTTAAGSFDFFYELPTFAWYHLVFTRAGGVGRLYVNGVLRDEKTTLGTGNIQGFGFPAGGSNQFHIGVSQSSSAWQSVGTGEPAIYDYALSAAQVKAHYEAALLVLPVSVTFKVRASLELDTDQIIPVDFPFLHNFVDTIEGAPRPVIETLSFKTHVNQSEPDFQQRVNAQPHHVDRTLEYAITTTEKLARSRMIAALSKPAEYYKLPISIDWTVLTAQASSGADTLSLDTTLRDFELGSYCVAWSDSFDAATYQFFKITSITDTELGISPDVGTTLPIGSGVAPARIACLPEENDDIESHAIDKETELLKFSIVSTELSTRRLTEYVATSTYKSIEVFSLEKAQVSWLNLRRPTRRRRVDSTEIPAGNDYYRALDTGSPSSVPIGLTLTSRAARAEFYGWLNTRQGKQNPVWIPSSETDLIYVGQASGSVTIKSGFIANYFNAQNKRDLQILLTDGTVTNCRITNAVDNGNGTETLSISPGIPGGKTGQKISFLKLCTAPDNFELRHYNNPADPDAMVTQCNFVFTELLTTPA